MYFRPYSTVTDPENDITDFGMNSDLRCVDAPTVPPLTFGELRSIMKEVWRQFFRLAD